MTRKKRIPIPDAIAAQVMFDSDSRCCRCHRPESPAQIHHIDEDPANNDPDNLALLCLECHDKTQITGGSGRKLNAPLVRKYRDAWLADVKYRRAREAGRIQAAPPPPPQPVMSREQARAHAQRLRSIYKTFYDGVRTLHYVAIESWRAPQGETWQERALRFQALVDRARHGIDSTLPDLSIEPGADAVCNAFETFRVFLNATVNDAYKHHTQPPADVGFWRNLGNRWGVNYSRNQVDEMYAKIQQAIRDHLAQLDQHS